MARFAAMRTLTESEPHNQILMKKRMAYRAKSRVLPGPHMLKTKLCRFTTCPYGDRCFFAHSESELRHGPIDTSDSNDSPLSYEKDNASTATLTNQDSPVPQVPDPESAAAMLPMSIWPPFIDPLQPYVPAMTLEDIGKLLIAAEPDFYLD